MQHTNTPLVGGGIKPPGVSTQHNPRLGRGRGGPRPFYAARTSTPKSTAPALAWAAKAAATPPACAKENIVALCDADTGTLDKAGVKYPQSPAVPGFPQALREGQRDRRRDGLHPRPHARPGQRDAMKMGKHVFCRNRSPTPSTRRAMMRQLAKDKKLATQMGNQGSAGAGLRRAVEVVQAGVIGPVRQLHRVVQPPDLAPRAWNGPKARIPSPRRSTGTSGSDRPPNAPTRAGPITRSSGAGGRISAPALWATCLSHGQHAFRR